VGRRDFQGALVASVLARANPGPILLAGSNGLSRSALREVVRLNPVGAFVVGSEESVPAAVVSQLQKKGLPEGSIARISGENPADSARLVAASMDTRSQGDKDGNKPAFNAAVIVNPKLPSAGAAAAFAAAQRYPILFVDKASVPEATKQALEEFDIPSTFVVGGVGAIEDSVLAELPDPKRLKGRGTLGISQAVADAAIKQGLPRNVIYLVAPKRRMDVALAGASVARVGGLLLLTGKAGAARSVMSALQEQAMVDRYVKFVS
ncbi:MAG: cell wall-binding repeat-containing protein, partial [Actinobacteria bacterium]|nr:cell wall-binding repeat-containing protein [Actinomycetota bacterium]